MESCIKVYMVSLIVIIMYTWYKSIHGITYNNLLYKKFKFY